MKLQDMTRPPKLTSRDSDPRYRNTLLLSYDELNQRRRVDQYNRSNPFRRELAAIAAAFEEQSSEFSDELFRFLKWFHPDRRRFPAIATRLANTPKAIRPLLEHYVTFAFRFRVWLHVMKKNSGRLWVRPVYEEISGSHLSATLRKGKLVPAREGYDLEEDYRWNLQKEEDGEPDEERGKRAGYRFLELRVDDKSDSDLMRIVDTFYDPLALNFIEIERRISQTRSQHYLACIIGELSGSQEWRHATAMLTELREKLYGESTRGRKADPRRLRVGMRMAAKHGPNVKMSANEVITQRGENPGSVPDKEYRRNEEAMRRASKAYRKSTSQFD